MLMSVIEGALSAPAFPELAGKRVLLTGVRRRCGVDIARAFAEHRGRVVVQFAEASPAMQAVAEIVAPVALEAQVFGPVGSAEEEVVEFAKAAVQAFGGLDAVVNVVPLETANLDRLASVSDIERLVAAQLALPFHIARIAANRMSLTWNEGLVLNVATLSAPASGSAQAFAAVAKATLAAMTRTQAEEWAGRGIRFNAIAPQILPGVGGADLRGEADVASLALYLASERGKALSGCVFEAAC
jgi:NAD(P)-dependent dehydrogenase (short-subunit alcohol dehydrogenase family)